MWIRGQCFEFFLKEVLSYSYPSRSLLKDANENSIETVLIL